MVGIYGHQLDRDRPNIRRDAFNVAIAEGRVVKGREQQHVPTVPSVRCPPPTKLSYVNPLYRQI